MSAQARRARRLRVAEDFVPPHPWQRSLRRVSARGPFRDPLGQGILSVSAALATAIAGLWLWTAGHPRLAALTLLLSVVDAVAYVGLTARAFKRDKAVQFWVERRRLRLDLGREEANRQFLLQAFIQLDRLQREPASEASVEEALGRMVSLTYRVFAPGQDELAVLLVEERERRCEIVHSALGQGTRWHALRSGKHCELDGLLEERLDELSPHHYAQKISTSTLPLWLVVLHDSPLTRAELELLHPLPRIFESVANQKRGSSVFPEQRHLRLLSS